MNEFEQTKLESRGIQKLIYSADFAIIKEKFVRDGKNALAELIEQESSEARARLKYILSVFDWFKMNAEKEEVLNILEKRSQNDY